MKGKSFVRMSDDGITYCSACKSDIVCDKKGDMPDFCPKCGRHLDYSKFIKETRFESGEC